MKNRQFVTSDDYELFDAYYDGVPVHKWESPYFTRAQVEEFAPGTYRFCEPHTPLNSRDVPILILYSGDDPRGEVIESCQITTDDGQVLEGYQLPGEFMLATELDCDECENPARWIMEDNDSGEKSPMCSECSWRAYDAGRSQSDGEIIREGV